jgi:hypothetical protein
MTEDTRQSENRPQLQQVKQQPIVKSLTDGNIAQNPMTSHPMPSINETETEIETENETKTKTKTKNETETDTETETETEISVMESEE